MSFMGSVINAQFVFVLAINFLAVYIMTSMYDSLKKGLSKDVVFDYLGFLVSTLVIGLAAGLFHSSDLPTPLLLLICACLASWNFGLVNWPLLWPRLAGKISNRDVEMQVVIVTGIVGTLFTLVILHRVVLG